MVLFYSSRNKNNTLVFMSMSDLATFIQYMQHRLAAHDKMASNALS